MGQAGGQATDRFAAGFGPRRVLVATPVTAATRAALADLSSTTYLPSLAAEPAALQGVLEELRPDTLVVGSNPVDAGTLRRWVCAVRADGARGRLLLVRRGTSLAAIDLAAAAELDVEVRNTPEVNARYLARYLVDALLAEAEAQSRPFDVGLLGAGAINTAAARLLVGAGHRVLVHTPRLAARDGATWERWLSGAGLAEARDAGRVRLEPDLDALFGHADLLAVAIPLTVSGSCPTRGLIRGSHLKAFAGRAIVSVSEPEIFSPGGLRGAYGRRDVRVLIDNAAPLLATVRRDIAEWFGDVERLRPGFALRSEALHVPGCGEDLDQAFLAVAASADLADAAARPGAVLPPADRIGPIVVVGAGIIGLTVALALRDAGWPDIEVIDAAPLDRTDPGAQGTTYSGTDGRHISVAESLPHAAASRRDVLRRSSADGGWGGLADRLDPRERGWADAFERLADRPGLHALLTEEVLALNRLGLRGWESLFARRPELLDGVRVDERLPRVYLTAAELATGRALQNRVNDRTRDLSDRELREGWPALATRASGVIAGAVEVDGYAVNIHRLADNIRAALAHAGVRVRHDAHAVAIEPADATGPVVTHHGGTDFAPTNHGPTNHGPTNHGGTDFGGTDFGGAHYGGAHYGGGDHEDGRPRRVDPVGARGGVPARSARPGHADGWGAVRGSTTVLARAPAPHAWLEPGFDLDPRRRAGFEVRLADGSTVRAGAAIVTVGGRDLARVGPPAAASVGTIQQVLGCSITVPNPGIRRALKVQAPDPIGVVNITLSPDGSRLHASGGFRWLGLAEVEPDEPTVTALCAALETTVARVLPGLAEADGTLRVIDRRICERPMTPDGIPVLERVGGPDGLLVIAGGTGAGGTVQAPAIARMVSALLAGEEDCAHLSMRPDRVSLAHPAEHNPAEHNPAQHDR